MASPIAPIRRIAVSLGGGYVPGLQQPNDEGMIDEVDGLAQCWSLMA